MTPTPGETAYTAYRQHSDGKSLVSGVPIPEWQREFAQRQALIDAAPFVDAEA